MDRPYDINESASRFEREEPSSFADHEDESVSGGGPSTMDRPKPNASEETPLKEE